MKRIILLGLIGVLICSMGSAQIAQIEVNPVEKEKIRKELDWAWNLSQLEILAELGLSEEEWRDICNEYTDKKILRMYRRLTAKELENILKRERLGEELTKKEQEVVKARSDIWNDKAERELAIKQGVSKEEVRKRLEERTRERIIEKLGVTKEEYDEAIR